MVKIAINAGHYKKTAGKRCLKKLDVNQTREWTLNDRIADKLEDLLRSYDCEVLRIDDTTGLIDTSLSKRCKKANEWGADIYISIHHNAGVNGGSGGGTVVFYYSSNPERKTQAQALYNAVVARTGLIGNRANKVVKKGFYELKHTRMCSMLLENGFMDSSSDVPRILTEDHADKTARGLLDFIVKEFNLGDVPSTYKVRITADLLNYRQGPSTSYKINGTVKKGEVYTIVETSGSWGRLKSGAGWINLKYTTRI